MGTALADCSLVVMDADGQPWPEGVLTLAEVATRGRQRLVTGAAEEHLFKERAAAIARDALVARGDVVALFQEAVDAVNATLAQFETIKRFALIPSEFTIAGGEFAPTMNVRRRVVEERWRGVIEKLYEEDRRLAT